MHRLADLIDANVDRLAAVECADMAMLLRSLRARVISRGARNFRAYADLAVALRGARLGVERHPQPRDSHAERSRSRDHAVERAVHVVYLEDSARARSRLHRDPQAGGMVAALVLAPLRPRHGGGLPTGRVQRRPGDRRRGRGRADAASRCAADLVHRLAGDGGSHRHGRRDATSSRSPASSAARGRCSCSPTPTSTQPPGRPPASTTTPARSASPERACSSSGSVADEFLELFHRFTDEHVLGDPRDDATTVSPLIHPEHLARVEGFVERARTNGDEIVRGGRRREDVGPLFYDPTLVRPRSNDSEIVQREVFGPVLTFQTFADEDEARRPRELDALRALGDRLHRLGGAGRARRPFRARGNGVGQHVPRPRPDGAVRRHRHLRHRPRGRRLRARLLLRPEDAADSRRNHCVSR